MQAGVTCTRFANFTAWKKWLEKKNHDPAPELVAYTLMRSVSHASHWCGHNSLSPIGHKFRCWVIVLFLQSPHSSCVVSEACTGSTDLPFLCKYKILVERSPPLLGLSAPLHPQQSFNESGTQFSLQHNHCNFIKFVNSYQPKTRPFDLFHLKLVYLRNNYYYCNIGCSKWRNQDKKGGQSFTGSIMIFSSSAYLEDV